MINSKNAIDTDAQHLFERTVSLYECEVIAEGESGGKKKKVTVDCSLQGV